MLTADEITQYGQSLAEVARPHADPVRAIAEHSIALGRAHEWTADEIMKIGLAALETLGRAKRSP